MKAQSDKIAVLKLSHNPARNKQASQLGVGTDATIINITANKMTNLTQAYSDTVSMKVGK